MEFIKRNYEKIILGLVLLGLVGVLAFMPVMIFYDQLRTKEFSSSIVNPHVDPLQPLDLSRQQAVLDRLKSPVQLDFSTTSKLFNPVQWQKDKNGNLVKSSGLGPNAAVVTKITPLYLSISLDSVITNTLGNRYVLIVENQTAALPALRHPKRFYVSEGETIKNVCKLDKVVGPPNAPTELDLILADTGKPGKLKPDHPFQRVDSYTADVKYPPDNNLNFTAQRVGDHLGFGGDDYIIIAIDQNDVILLAQSNQKKYILPYAP